MPVQKNFRQTFNVARLTLAASFITSLGLLAAAPLTQADALVEACNKCHTLDKKDVPVISGISALALEEALLAYTNGSRKARVLDGKDMKTELEKLSEEQIKHLIGHYSAQKFTPVTQDVDAALAAQGAKLHQTHCEKCHTENGTLAEDDSSILAGQWKGYLLEEMNQYKTGGRTGDKKMIDIIKTMDEAQFKALVEFYASQK